MDELINACKREKKIIIYGAGAVANILFLFLKKRIPNCEIICFVVSELQKGQTNLNGLEVREAKSELLRNRDKFVCVATQPHVQKSICSNLQEWGISKYYVLDTDELINTFYEELYKIPISNNKIVFMHMKGLGYGGNPKYIAEKLLEIDTQRKLDIVWVVDNDEYVFPEHIRTVKYWSNEYYYEMATAHIWIDNTRKTYEIRKRTGQYYIQTWHGAAPGKKVEKDAEDYLSGTYIVNAKRDSLMADLFISGSEFYTQLYQHAFWYNGEIFKAGLPRHDIFFNKSNISEKLRKLYKVPDDAGIVLYAPTFRKNYSNKYYNLDFEKIRDALENRFCKKFVFFVSKHPDIRNIVEYNFDNRHKYTFVGDYEDFQEILSVSDILITDYSGCVYDFSFTDRLIILYQPDYDSYVKDEREFYIPMKDLPYLHGTTNDELASAILDFDEKSYVKLLKKYMSQFGNYDDGHASEKIARYIWNLIGEKK